jgi:hypothetical protein
MVRFWKVMWTWVMLGVLTLAFGAIGNVALVVGEANILRANTTLVVENGMALEEKDTLTTAKNAKVQLRFSDDTIISLGSEAEFSIETFVNDDTAPKAKFGIAKGAFGAITGKIGKLAPQDFALQTKTATIGIRGTHIRGRTGLSGDVISCLRGAISVTSLSTGQSVAVLAGQITRIAPGAPPAPPRNIEPGDLDAMGDAPNEGGGAPAGGGEAPAPMQIAMGQVTPAVAEQAMQTVLDALATNLISGGVRRTGILALSGLATSGADIDWVINLMIDRYTAAMTGSIKESSSEIPDYILNIAGQSGFVDFTDELEDALAEDGLNFGGWAHPAWGSYTVHGDQNSFYVADYLFSRNHFVEYEGVYFGELDAWPVYPGQTTPLDEYVAWGYWTTGLAHSEDDYFVLGKDATKASEFIDNIVNVDNYTYRGKVFGGIFNSSGEWTDDINTATSDVKLVFDFGEGNLDTDSYIKFSDYSENSWDLAVGSSSFNQDGFNGNLRQGNYAGDLIGKFYGDRAQAVGGTFGILHDNDGDGAKGVFKAVRQ